MVILRLMPPPPHTPPRRSKWAWLGWEVLFLAVFTAGTWWAMATMKHARR